MDQLFKGESTKYKTCTNGPQVVIYLLEGQLRRGVGGGGGGAGDLLSQLTLLVLWASGPLGLWASGPLGLWASGPLVLLF